ncbi:TPA: IgG-binding virulence factor TspB family protein [Neisseria subflava]
MNDTRSLFYSRRFALCSRLLVLVCFGTQVLSPLTAFAEVGLPPPAQHQNAGFPSDQALQRRGYDPKTGIWKVDVQNNGKPTVTKNGGNINGSQGKNVTVTGRYGETGTMNTTVNQRVGTSAIQKTATGVWFGSSAANALSKNGSYVATQLRAGNYQSAFEGSVLALGDFGNNLFGGLPESIVNLGRSLGLVNSPSPQQFRDAAERFYAGQRQAEAEGNYQKAVANAAAKKAAEAAQKAKAQQEKKENLEKQEKSGKNVVLVRFHEFGYLGENIEWKSYVSSTPSGRFDIGNYDLSKIKSNITYKYSDDLTITYSPKFAGVDGQFLGLNFYPNSELNRKNIINNNDSVDINDFMLTQKEMLDILKRMLENNQTNHAELMNQLAKMGVMNQSAEQSTFSPDTALSAPYTPEGSSTPQQTRFKMNQDGTVGVDYVPRPDLKPNSPEAPNKPEKTTPSRQESPDTPNAPNSPNSPNTPNEPNSPNSPNNQQTPKQQENGLCSIFPNIAACADMGEVEAQEPEVPQNTIDIGSIKPTDTFKTDGVCPSPKTFDMGILGTFEMSYENVCYIASKIRPILILVTIISCGWAAYAAVKEL